MALSTEKIGIAIIGCGHWGPNHIRNFSNHRQARVFYCVDMDAKRLEAMADMFPGIEATNDLAKVLADLRVTAVVIATPTSSHFQIANRALSAGKHVLCEKPLAANSYEAEKLVSLARSTGNVLMVGHVFLFNAGIVKFRQLIDAGELGRHSATHRDDIRDHQIGLQITQHRQVQHRHSRGPVVQFGTRIGVIV